MVALNLTLVVFAIFILFGKAAAIDEGDIKGALGDKRRFNQFSVSWIGSARNVENISRGCEACQAEKPDTMMFSCQKGWKCDCYVKVPWKQPVTIASSDMFAGVCEDPMCLTSPNYPYDYPRNINSTQTLSVPTGQNIEITFKHFGVSANTTECPHDYVQFIDGNGKLIGKKLCGRSLPQKFTIPTSTASVYFHSNGWIEYKGFKLCYQPVPGCNEGATGITCCPEFTEGDNLQKGKEIFIQENQMANYTTCADACKDLHKESTGITVSKTEKYGNKKDGKDKCWCEFGEPKLEANQNYETCMFKK